MAELAKDSAASPARSRFFLWMSVPMAGIIIGTLVTILTGQRDLAKGMLEMYGVTYISLVALIGFAALFIMAVRNVSNRETHKRYIMLATLLLVIAGLNRFFNVMFGIGFDGHLSYLPK